MADHASGNPNSNEALIVLLATTAFGGRPTNGRVLRTLVMAFAVAIGAAAVEALKPTTVYVGVHAVVVCAAIGATMLKAHEAVETTVCVVDATLGDAVAVVAAIVLPECILAVCVLHARDAVSINAETSPALAWGRARSTFAIHARAITGAILLNRLDGARSIGE